jgi:hypothetical protein
MKNFPKKTEIIGGLKNLFVFEDLKKIENKGGKPVISFSRYFRRKFSTAAGASAVGSLLLKGCGGNNKNQTDTTAAPETARAVLGYMPMVEAAALAIAKEKGFFAKYDMTEKYPMHGEFQLRSESAPL